jgi:hypothetical protein
MEMKTRPFSWWGCALALVVLVVIPLVFYGGLDRTSSQEQLTVCRSNLQNYAAALQLYGTDHGGRLPPRLELVVAPKYQPRPLTCPSGSAYVYETSGSKFTLCCRGDHHGKALQGRGFQGDSRGFPQYTNGQGLLP